MSSRVRQDEQGMGKIQVQVQNRVGERVVCETYRALLETNTIDAVSLRSAAGGPVAGHSCPSHKIEVRTDRWPRVGSNRTIGYSSESKAREK